METAYFDAETPIRRVCGDTFWLYVPLIRTEEGVQRYLTQQEAQDFAAQYVNRRCTIRARLGKPDEVELFTTSTITVVTDPTQSAGKPGLYAMGPATDTVASKIPPNVLYNIDLQVDDGTPLGVYTLVWGYIQFSLDSTRATGA